MLETGVIFPKAIWFDKWIRITGQFGVYYAMLSQILHILHVTFSIVTLGFCQTLIRTFVLEKMITGT
jgi:hypothetical protein